jgi:hypothetical protein
MDKFETEMTDCRKCKHRVFDEQFCSYICKRYNHKLRDIYKYVDCNGYEKKEVAAYER